MCRRIHRANTQIRHMYIEIQIQLIQNTDTLKYIDTNYDVDTEAVAEMRYAG